MANALIIFKQAVIMFLYMAIGFVLFRKKLITREGSASMANLLLYVIIPVVMIQSFQVDYTPAKAREFVSSTLAAAVLLLVSMLISHLFFRKNPVNDFGTALFIAAMAPVGANVAVYAQKQGKDYSYAVGLVCVSTLLCILTMPLLFLMAETLTR